MNYKQQRYVLFRHFKLAYGTHLSDAQLDDIQDIYFDIRKETIFKLGMQRFINSAIGFVILILGLILPVDVGWFFFVIWGLFFLYNFIHAMDAYIDHKRLKDPQRISDMEVDVDEQKKD